MTILHLCWGLEKTNGAANIARLIMGEQRAKAEAQGGEITLKSWLGIGEIRNADEIWVHCGWYYGIWWAVFWAKKLGKRVYWVPECCYDPIRLKYHGWKKRLAGPFERWALRQADVIFATCKAEAEWCINYIGKRCPKVEVTDIKRFFKIKCRGKSEERSGKSEKLHVLYLGRPHVLKGTKYLVQAVEGLKNVELRMVSNHHGEELEKDWEWCDVMCLPTLSDNFGLVIAEALERGKRVITTDGAPVWEGQSGVIYLKGYREGSDAVRVEMLKGALCESLDS